MRGAYYNEFDPFAAAWLRQLIADGHLPAGDVDTRSITDVRPADLVGYTQCHFFAGLGGWPYALRLAGWPDTRPVWTGSCPCQPFSNGGAQDGFTDPRHLWPAWFGLLRESRPDCCFGEQVASAVRFGWLDLVARDLEAEGYAVGAAILGAHSVNAPHRRDRLYWVADAAGQGGPRLEPVGSARADGPWGWRGEADLRAIADAPFRCGDRWPQPLLRAVAHGLPARVDYLRAAGNAIVPQVAAAFVGAYLDA